MTQTLWLQNMSASYSPIIAVYLSSWIMSHVRIYFRIDQNMNFRLNQVLFRNFTLQVISVACFIFSGEKLLRILASD